MAKAINDEVTKSANYLREQIDAFKSVILLYSTPIPQTAEKITDPPKFHPQAGIQLRQLEFDDKRYVQQTLYVLSDGSLLEKNQTTRQHETINTKITDEYAASTYDADVCVEALWTFMKARLQERKTDNANIDKRRSAS